ncbi:MAG: SDR family NAD(P)-dependent oxidoreductase, partial [Gammaproteobacteria bacterium]|nr:SDR family NAD(P)-dependent oxidoreductase [Gammaproteobacteria bacterium]
MPIVLVTGSSRGIGLELCRQFRARGADVIAVCRRSSAALEELGVRIIDGIDVAEPAAAKELRRRLDGVHVDILVNNAGILRRDGLEDIDFEGILEQFRVNTLGPLRITHALLD